MIRYIGVVTRLADTWSNFY